MDLKIFQTIPPWEWPVDADETFLKVLRDDRADAADRLLAAEFAGDLTVINEELVDGLLSIVQNGEESEALRSTAAIALGPVLEEATMGDFDDPDDPITEETFHRIQDSLHSLFMEAGMSKQVRRRILEASVRAPQDWHREAVRDAYSTDDKEWRMTAVFSMSWIPGFDKEILQELESSDPEILYEAVRASGNQELRAAWSRVAALATSESTEKILRLAAIEAATTIRPREALVILSDLHHSEDDDIAEAIDEAMSAAHAMSGDYDEDVDADEEDEDEGEDDNDDRYVH